jgi:hypothetical protein
MSYGDASGARSKKGELKNEGYSHDVDENKHRRK